VRGTADEEEVEEGAAAAGVAALADTEEAEEADMKIGRSDWKRYGMKFQREKHSTGDEC
jgi:hypothetical protein